MIELNFEQFCMVVFLGVGLFLLLLICLHWLRRIVYQRRVCREILHCPACGDVFVDRGKEKRPACRGCGRATLRYDDRSLG